MDAKIRKKRENRVEIIVERKKEKIEIRKLEAKDRELECMKNNKEELREKQLKK